MRRIIMLVTVALVMAAMMVAMAMPAFAAPKGGQSNDKSCGASNPDIAVPPGQTNEDLGECGFQNNPHGGPPGLGF